MEVRSVKHQYHYLHVILALFSCQFGILSFFGFTQEVVLVECVLRTCGDQLAYIDVEMFTCVISRQLECAWHLLPVVHILACVRLFTSLPKR